MKEKIRDFQVKVWTFFSLVICGAEQIRKKAYLRGGILFVLYVSDLTYLIFCSGVLQYATTALIFLIVAFTWLYNLLDVIDLSKAADSSAGKMSDELYEKGRVLYFKGKLPEAKACFEGILKKNHQDMDTVYQLAKINKELGNAAAANRLFKRYIKNGEKIEWIEEAKEAVR